MDPNGKAALVTGGARRLGRELSLALARAGADVVVNYFDSAAEAADVCREIEALGRRALPVQGDVAVKADAVRMVNAAADTFGRLDILVNNASTFETTPLLSISEEAWDRVMAVNLKGPFLLSQAAEPLLRAQGHGVIVNLADLAALQPWPAYGHHGVSKAGLLHLTRVLARAFAPQIRVNAIAPGTVLPPEDYTAAQVESLRGKTPLQRIGSPADVAQAMLYLIESDFVTGDVIVVDGGRLLV